MVAKSVSKKLIRVTGITLGILLALLVGFHFWFKSYAKGLIEDMVETNSNGKVKLKIGKFHFNYFSRKIQMDNAVFYSTDTATGTTAYRFSVEKIDLRAKAILPILFKKKILIDSLNLMRPQIEVTRLRQIEKPDKKQRKDVSIPEEMGKVYSSIQDALEVLKVKKFLIEDGTFRLVNKIAPGQLPMEIGNLYFQIDNLEVDSTKSEGKDKILFSDNVTFRSHDQDILFPDGRHRLSFKQFRINLQKKLVEFDSCTIAATRKDSSSASFNVFFDALDLTNIDFDTLYKSEVIKADSVYCINPRFNLEVDASRKKDPNKPPPRLENIIKQLTGDLLLEHVVVTNADFNIRTIKDGRPSTFTFSKNNFEMGGLSVDQEAPKAIKVRSFAMAIRNYENFLKDSSYSIRFDSVILKDDRITLSNFIFQKLENGRILNSFSIPQFNLQGLSWDDLVFDRRLKAEQAIMFNPHISYSSSYSKGGQQNIFVSLGAVNEFMDLQFLDIREGMIDLRLKNNIRVQLDKANVAVQSNSLLTSTQISGIKNSLTNLNFEKGRVQAGDLLIELDNIRYAGPNGKFEAGNMHVRSDKKNMDISLRDVTVAKMLVDEITGSVFANDLQWQKADVSINTTGWASGNEGDISRVELKNVRGNNTSVQVTSGNTGVSAKLNQLSFDELLRSPGARVKLDGLVTDGEQLRVSNKSYELSVNKYAIADNSPSSFDRVQFKNKTGRTTGDIALPSLSLVPHIQSLIDGNFSFDAVTVDKPIIRMTTVGKNEVADSEAHPLPAIDIHGLSVKQPVLHYREVRDSGMMTLNWKADKDPRNEVLASELHIGSGQYGLKGLQFHVADLQLTNPAGRTFNTGNGTLAGKASSFDLTKHGDGESEWKAQIDELAVTDLHLDSNGKKKATTVIASGFLENLVISPATIINMRELAAANETFKVKRFTGSHEDKNNLFRWFNAGIDRNDNSFSVDSFSMQPQLDRDAFLAAQSFQKDYISLRTGKIKAKTIDLAEYIRTNQLNIHQLLINDFSLKEYKDKQLPLKAGVVKPLPVNLLQQIPLAIAVDTTVFSNAFVHYTEKNDKNKLEGVVPITRLNGRIINLRNFDIKPGDSLDIEATGYLLDTAWIRLAVKESYTDTAYGFLMTAQIRPAELKLLNPILLPLASVKIRSGLLDTLSLQAIGREYQAYGELRFYYHDLKIDLLKEEGQKNKFKTGVANLLIKNKNESRTGAIYFVRLRDRSAINYLVKILTSGIANSLGIKNDKKTIKDYREEIEKMKLSSPKE